MGERLKTESVQINLVLRKLAVIEQEGCWRGSRVVVSFAKAFQRSRVVTLATSRLFALKIKIVLCKCQILKRACLFSINNYEWDKGKTRNTSI